MCIYLSIYLSICIYIYIYTYLYYCSSKQQMRCKPPSKVWVEVDGLLGRRTQSLSNDAVWLEIMSLAKYGKGLR